MSIVSDHTVSTMDADNANTPRAPIEGQIHIDIFRQKKNKTTVEISSSRPLQASKVLLGKTPQQALSIIPLLFSICGIAQTRTAIACLEQNLEIKTDPAIETARDMLVLVENAKEHLFRLFVDWPRLFNLETENTTLPYISQMIGEYKNALFQNGEAFNFDSLLNDNIKNAGYLIDKLEQYLQTNVFNCPTDEWLKIYNINDLHQWALQTNTIAAKSIVTICEQGLASQGQTDCQQLPVFENKDLLKRFDTQDAQQFIEQPEWNGHCYETTVLSRQYTQPLIQSLHNEFQTTLITRWVSRLVELASIPQLLKERLNQITHQQFTQPPHNSDNGIKQVEAARGRLIHRVKINNGVISNYQILAPTEWNFHPRGLAAKSLQTLAASKQVEIDQVAHLLINAIDPCVGYELRIH